tara:strand:+ start:1387 stop:1551 length:165 start_codon:yes stop_codon:yes gene_type:complete
MINKEMIFQLFIYISIFGIVENILLYFEISTGVKIILYILLLSITLKYLNPSNN